MIEVDTLVKENVKSKMFLTLNFQEIWDSTKRHNLRILGIKEGEDSQLKGPENIFNKITGEKFPNLKEMAIKVYEAYKTLERLDQKGKSPYHIKIKTKTIKSFKGKRPSNI